MFNWRIFHDKHHLGFISATCLACRIKSHVILDGMVWYGMLIVDLYSAIVVKSLQCADAKHQQTD